ncbi:hypothetical protein ACFE04_003757 [Oxalis oulophora]
MSSSNNLNLPAEIWCQIFSLLSTDDRLNVRLTCCHFYGLCNEFQVQRHEELVFHGDLNTGPALQWLSSSSKKVRNIRFNHVHVGDTILPYFEEHGGNIHSLSLENCKFEPRLFKSLLEQCSALQSFLLQVPRRNWSEEIDPQWSNQIFLQFLALFPRVKRLDLQFDVDESFDNLSLIPSDIASDNQFTASCIYDRILALKDQLEKLRLHFYTTDGSYSYSTIPVVEKIANIGMMNLKELSLNFEDNPYSLIPNPYNFSVCEPLNKACFEALVRSRLTRLKLEAHVRVDFEELSLKDTFPPNYLLKHFSIGTTSNDEDEIGLTEFLLTEFKFPLLKSLTICLNCSCIDFEKFLKILRQTPQVKFIKLQCLATIVPFEDLSRMVQILPNLCHIVIRDSERTNNYVRRPIDTSEYLHLFEVSVLPPLLFQNRHVDSLGQPEVQSITFFHPHLSQLSRFSCTEFRIDSTFLLSPGGHGSAASAKEIFTFSHSAASYIVVQFTKVTMSKLIYQQKFGAKFFHFLSTDDRLNIRLTCRHFYGLCNEIKVQRHEELVFHGDLNTGSALQWLSSNPRKVWNIRFNHVHIGDTILPYFQEHGGNIHSLSFQNCTFEPGLFRSLLEQCTALQSFLLEMPIIREEDPDPHVFCDIRALSANSITFEQRPIISSQHLCIYDRMLVLRNQLERLRLHFYSTHYAYSYSTIPLVGKIAEIEMRNLKELSLNFIESSKSLTPNPYRTFKHLTHIHCKFGSHLKTSPSTEIQLILNTIPGLVSLVYIFCDYSVGEPLNKACFQALVRSRLTRLKLQYDVRTDFPKAFLGGHFTTQIIF